VNVLDLFSGIGGFSLGLERAGMRTVAFCEIDPYCRAVLRKHWPWVHCFGDIRKLAGRDIHAAVDVICGGFPCQDISLAGDGAGITGERSGLWREYARLIRELRPSYVIVENVAALLGRGLGDVLGDLAESGYDAEWDCIPASAVGAEHERDRLWLVAYPMRQGLPLGSNAGENGSDARIFTARLGSALRAEGERMERRGAARWGGNVHGIRGRVDRIRALGNAVYPTIPEIIGEAIMSADCCRGDVEQLA
jgi:DNA (cytosine-5)-methyltransferase 1